METSPRNSSHSPLPHSPSPPENDNSAQSQKESPALPHELKRLPESNQKDSPTSGGGVRPLLSASSDNSAGVRKRARLTPTTDISGEPRFQPENQDRQGLFLQMQQNQFWRQEQLSNMLPPPPQQPPMRQSQRSQSLLLQPMQQGQRFQPLLPCTMKQSQRSQPLLMHPMKQQKLLFPTPQQSQRRQPLLQEHPQPQCQWQPQQLPQQLMSRPTKQTNIAGGGGGDQSFSYSNFLQEVMRYLWSRPQNHSIEFWKQYVAKYYDPKAKERWCLSMCTDNRIPTRNDGESCRICDWGPKKGYELSFEELPERFKAKFDIAISERLYPGKLEEHKSPEDGMTVLLCPQATHESIYEREYIIHKGMFRLVITDQRKILSWEFCATDRQVCASTPRPPASPSENWLGTEDILRRSEAINVSDGSPEENSQSNNRFLAQAVLPRVISRRPEVRLQANSQGHQINQITMNSTRAINSCPTGHHGITHNKVIAEQNADQMAGIPVSGGANNIQVTVPGRLSFDHHGSTHNRVITEQNADQMSGIPVSGGANNIQVTGPGRLSFDHHGRTHNRIITEQNADQMSGIPVSGGANNIQVTGPGRLSFDSMAVCLLRNAAANLQMLSAEQNTGQSSHIITGGHNANGVSSNGVASSSRTTQTTSASPVGCSETGLLPVRAVELQGQELSTRENLASDQPPLNNDTASRPMDISDLQYFVNQLNDSDIKMLQNCISNSGDTTDAKAFGNEAEIEAYLTGSTFTENPVA